MKNLVKILEVWRHLNTAAVLCGRAECRLDLSAVQQPTSLRTGSLSVDRWPMGPHHARRAPHHAPRPLPRVWSGVGWFAARCVLIHRFVSHLLLLLWLPAPPSVGVARSSWLRYMCRCVALVTCRVAESDSERWFISFRRLLAVPT
jgi:hypothetical protein